MYVKKFVIFMLIAVQIGLLCFFGSMSLHLIRLNEEISSYKKELINYDKKIDKENNIKNELQEKMNSFEQEKRLKQERLNNLKTVKETTENSINNMKEKLGQ